MTSPIVTNSFLIRRAQITVDTFSDLQKLVVFVLFDLMQFNNRLPYVLSSTILLWCLTQKLNVLVLIVCGLVYLFELIICAALITWSAQIFIITSLFNILNLWLISISWDSTIILAQFMQRLVVTSILFIIESHWIKPISSTAVTQTRICISAVNANLPLNT